MLLDFLRSFASSPQPIAVQHQSGALPYKIVNGRVVFLLVTSRKTGRWIFPKGSISNGMTAWDSAAEEAVEEAGVSGQIAQQAVGRYENIDKGVRVAVDLYPLRVETQLDTWQEMDQRLRHWALLTETKRLLSDRKLGALAEAVHRGVTTTRIRR